ncbi:ADP-ribose glycohydrolase MACROD1 isoform X2 [Spea bombifrons]|uniref:ADP-ribose glycohydrolase MACROD1 isoform X2 n=1 Tax=Spea bombifrons TaxID=233779 RepID=UPI00234A6F49|nr:ADP-ribose glycohydrolase MACROD1 isoform X2 [Spea bombifrons]XP_053304665.1 ADP-ribose glycohydrolase MACROD1 isoform X2 [Spea bombifrons]
MISMLLRRTFGVLSFARAPLLEAARCPFGGSHLSPANSTNRGYEADFIVCRQLNFSTGHRVQCYWFLTDHAQSVLSFALKPLLLNKLATSIFFPPYLLRRHMATSGKVDLNSPSTSWKEAKSYLKGLNNKKRREHYGMKDFIKLKDIPTWKDAAKKRNVKQPEEVKYPKNKDLNEKISLFRGDITKLEVDAIVNTANSSLLGGGGVDGCIHRAAGPLLKLECSSLGGCETGLAKMTCGYLLPAKYVIHTVGPVAQGQPGPSQEEDLKNCYKNSLKVAVEGKLCSVAFPCISTGVFGYPADAAADVALGVIRSVLEEGKDKFDRIIICVFLEKDEQIYLQKFPEYFPLA